MLLQNNALLISTLLEEKAKSILSVIPLVRYSAQNDNCDMLCIDKVAKNAYSCLRMAQNLKSYALLNGKTPQTNAFCITSSLNNFIQDTKKVCNNINIELICTHNDLFISANEELFIICVANIICNSVIYSTEKTQINICVYKTNGFAVIKTHDNAKGINPTLISNMYSAFVSKDPYDETLPTQALGLGLAVVQSFTQCYNGKLITESRRGVGSSLTMLLPLIKNFNATNYIKNNTNFLSDKYSVLYAQFCDFCKLPV